MICTNSNDIHILQFIIKLPDFRVQVFQFILGKVSISVGRMSVFIVFVKVVLKRTVLNFMRPQKVPFV